MVPEAPLTNSTLVAIAVLGLGARPAAADRVSRGCASLLGLAPTSWGSGRVGAVSGEARDTEQAGGPRLRVCSYLPRASCPLAAGWPLVLSHPRMPCPSWPHSPRGHPVAALPALPTPPPACSGPSVVLDSGSHPLSLWEGEEPRGWPQLTVVLWGRGGQAPAWSGVCSEAPCEVGTSGAGAPGGAHSGCTVCRACRPRS